MNKQEFWSLIAESKAFDQEEWLVEKLAQKGLEEVLDFSTFFEQFMNESYQSRLWGAAFLLMGGCSDDAFDYFRGWLIGQGEEIYQRVLEDPEFLAQYIDEENLDEEGYPQNEPLLMVGFDAYTLIKKGDTEWDDALYDEFDEALDVRGRHELPDIEFDWEEEDLPELFPLLWARFGEEPLG